MSSVLESPSKIVRLDLSLNELTALEHMGLQPFYNLRELNASLNRINKYVSILKYKGVLASINIFLPSVFIHCFPQIIHVIQLDHWKFQIFHSFIGKTVFPFKST